MAAATALESFEDHRRLLTGVAYRMLGRFADAEDVVQDVWLKWAALDQSQVREPKAYLVRMTTHLAIDRLRQAQSRRESYVGPWLPEPIATDFGEAVPDTAEQAVLADTVGVAVLVVLESLSPLERAVFVLREAFGYPFAEIAELLDRSEPAVRQLAGRARRHVDERRPRYTVDPQERRDLTERFLAAAAGGRLTDLMELLAPDVSLVADSGGKSRAPRRIVASADKVGRFLVGISDRAPIDPSFEFREVNGVLALIVLSQGKPDSVVTLETSNGRIDTIYLVRNPDKMAGLL